MPVTDVPAVEFPDRAERAKLGMILAGRFFGQFRPYLWFGMERLCDVGTPS